MAAKPKTPPKRNNQLPAAPIDWEQDSGAGTKNMDVDSLAVPFLKVLQKGSPEVDEASGQALPKAKEGMFFETASQRLHDGKKGIDFLQCSFRRQFIHWGPKFGQYKGAFTPEQAKAMVADETVVRMENRLYFPLNGKIDTKKCDRLVDVREHFILLIGNGGEFYQRCLFPLASTQIKKSRNLNSWLEDFREPRKDGQGTFNPATFVHVIHANTLPESNDEGTWMGVNFKIERQLDRLKEAELYQVARTFQRGVEAGQVETNYAVMAGEEGPSNGDEEEGQPRRRGF